jgi:hypothetical protein
MVSADRVRARIRPQGQSRDVLDEAVRRTGVAQVSASSIALVEDRLRTIKPALEGHFLVQLAGWERPQFCIYEEGDGSISTGATIRTHQITSEHAGFPYPSC